MTWGEEVQNRAVCPSGFKIQFFFKRHQLKKKKKENVECVSQFEAEEGVFAHRQGWVSAELPASR